jgi:outer membrane protein TolC
MVALACLVALTGCVNSREIYLDARASRARSYRAWASTKHGGGQSGVLLNGELSLQQAIEVACRHNKDIQSALQELARAKGRLWLGLSAALPSLNAYASYHRLDKPSGSVQIAGITLSPGDRDSYSQGLVLRQPLFDGGAISASVRSAHVFELMADETVRGTVGGVVFEVARGYLDVLLAQKLHEVYQSALLSAQEQLESVQRMKDTGLATDFDVLRAQVEVSSIEADMMRQKSKLSLAVSSFLSVMGLSQDSDVSLISELTHAPISPEFDVMVSHAYGRRADLYYAELDLRMQQEELRRARSGYWPSVDAVFTNLYAKPDPHNSSRIKWGRRWYGGISLTWTLFDGMRREGEIAEGRAILRQKELRIRNLEEKVLLELRQGMLGVEDAERVIKAQELNVKGAQEGLRLATRGYPDIATFAEVTDARASLVRAEGLYWEAVAQHCLARLSLQQATGMLEPEPGAEHDPSEVPLPAWQPVLAEPSGADSGPLPE